MIALRNTIQIKILQRMRSRRSRHFRPLLWVFEKLHYAIGKVLVLAQRHAKTASSLLNNIRYAFGFEGHRR